MGRSRASPDRATHPESLSVIAADHCHAATDPGRPTGAAPIEQEDAPVRFARGEPTRDTTPGERLGHLAGAVGATEQGARLHDRRGDEPDGQAETIRRHGSEGSGDGLVGEPIRRDVPDTMFT
jgi:hypothetical protein